MDIVFVAGMMVVLSAGFLMMMILSLSKMSRLGERSGTCDDGGVIVIVIVDGLRLLLALVLFSAAGGEGAPLLLTVIQTEQAVEEICREREKK